MPVRDPDVLDAELRDRGLRLLRGLGFNNSYAMVVRREQVRNAELADNRRPGAASPSSGWCSATNSSNAKTVGRVYREHTASTGR